MHSIDRFKIARRLNNFAAEYRRKIPVLLECNVSSEPSKFGWQTWEEGRWPEFVGEIASLIELSNLDVCGLMTMPPYDPDPEKSRSYFRKHRHLCR